MRVASFPLFGAQQEHVDVCKFAINLVHVFWVFEGVWNVKFCLAPRWDTLYKRLRRALGPPRKFQLKYFYTLKCMLFLKRISNYNLFQIIGTSRKVKLEILQCKLCGWDLLSTCAWLSKVHIRKAFRAINGEEKKIFHKTWFFFDLKKLALFWNRCT